MQSAGILTLPKTSSRNSRTCAGRTALRLNFAIDSIFDEYEDAGAIRNSRFQK
jgi:hypothetical protein